MSTASVPNTFQNAVTATGLQLDNNFGTIVAYLNDPLNRNNYAADTGNTNTVVLTFSPPVTAYSAGLEITFKVANTNTGATVLNANTVSAAPLVQPGGSDLASGQIQAGGIYKAAYNGSQWVYIGQNVLAASQGDQETATSVITFVSPGTQKFHPLHPKAMAWVNGTATGTLTNGALAALTNVARVVRLGAGTYSVGLTTAFSNTTFLTICFPARTAATGITMKEESNLRTTAGVVVTCLTTGGSAVDPDYFHFVAYGDLP